MPIKKFFKIVGLILLAFLVLYFGLMIVFSGLSNVTSKTVSNQLAIGTMDSLQVGVPSGGSGEMFSQGIAMDSAKALRQETAPGAASVTVDKKIIKTGNLLLKVEKADTAAENITNLAKLNKGEISDSNFSESSRGVKTGFITVRVPYQNFTVVFNEIKKVATQVVSESSNAQDITADFIDLEARLKNTQAEEASFVALLSRSGKIDDVLAVTKEIARVRGEIEQLQGQMRYLNSQTDMSTITVNMSEDAGLVSVSQDWRPWQTFKTSVKQLLTNGQNFVDGLISFIIIVLPMLLIYALIIWLIYYVGKKVYHKYFN